MPHVGVEGPFRHITENLDLFIFVALPQNTSFLLFQIRRLPWAIQMVQSDQPVLHVCPGSELRRRSDQDTHLAGSHLCEKLRFLGLGIGLMDKDDLLRRNALGCQLIPQIIVDIERAVRFGCREVTKNQLCSLVRCGLLPHLKSIFHAQIDLALLRVRQQIIDEPLIESTFSAIVGDLQHVVDARVKPTSAYIFRAVSEGRNQVLLLLARLQDLVDVLGLRHGELQHVRCLHVRRLFEEGDQFGQVKKAGKARLCAVARSLRRQLNCCYRLAKRRRPGIEVS